MAKCLFIGSLLLVGLSATAFSATINFDDLNASAGDVVLGSYQGLNWTNFSAYTTTPGFAGFNNSIHSSPNAAYSGGQVFTGSAMPIIGTISAASPFNFVSGDFGAGYYNNLNVTVEGLLNGTMRFTRTLTVGTQRANPFSFGFTGINEIEMFGATTASTTDPYSCGSFNCTQFTVDDLVVQPYTGTPEPSTMTLLGFCGFAGLILYRGRKSWTRSVRGLSSR